MTSAYECPSINTLVSSANKIKHNKSDDLEKLLTLKINNRGPNIDPCSTPQLVLEMKKSVTFARLYCCNAFFE